MQALILAVLLSFAGNSDPVIPGTQTRSVKVGKSTRSYHLHVPKQYDGKKPIPVVLVLHGAAMNGKLMMTMSGMNKSADENGFLAVYPDGTGQGKTFLTWNAGGRRGFAGNKVDDVAFFNALLDDLEKNFKIDANRIHACGLSNGGMMCYRLASELSDRIAAIAPVAGTMAIESCNNKRPVSVIHFHGTKDSIVPYNGVARGKSGFIMFKSVDGSIDLWVKANGCSKKAKITDLEDKAKDGTTVKKLQFGPGKEESEVVLIKIEGGGHTWPGSTFQIPFIGITCQDISANDVMWEFFQRHPKK